MDRREALKKMMAGGAVVAGASMVSSSPVFAAGSVGAGQPMGPGLTTPPPTGQIVNDKRNATWTITAPNVECSSGTKQIASSVFTRTLAGDLSVMVVSPLGGYVMDADTATFSAIGTGPGNSPFRQGDAFEVIWSVKYTCMDGAALLGCQIVNYTYHFINQANGNPNWQQVPGTPWVSSTQTCTS
jgi:hypothetical protein